MSDSAYEISKPQMDLLNAPKPIIDIVGRIDRPMFMYVRSAVMYLEARGCPDINVFITSTGGSVNDAFDIYDMLRLYSGHKTAKVRDKAASMAVLILQSCDLRQAAKHSGILIHHVSSDEVFYDSLVSKKKRKKLVAAMENDHRPMYQVLIERTGKSVEKIRRQCTKDKFMTAQKALKFGLIDDVV